MSGQIAFKVIYRDGSEYIGDPYLAPILDVVLIIEPDPNHGQKIVSGTGFYCYEKETSRWLGCDFWSMIAYMARPYPEKRVLVGVMIPDSEEWNSFYKRAVEDPDFPKRTGYYPDEALNLRMK